MPYLVNCGAELVRKAVMVAEGKKDAQKGDIHLFFWQ